MAGTIGDALRRQRLGAGLSQEQLAQSAGVGVRTLRDIENGRVRRPRPVSVRRLTQALSSSPSAGGDSAGVKVSVLGPLAIARDGLPTSLNSRMQRTLLGLLALRAGGFVYRDEIVDLLWPGGPPRTAVASLQGHVAALRTVLAPRRADPTRAPAIVRSNAGYSLRTAVDVAIFHEVRSQAEGADDPSVAVELYQRALDCWRGPVLVDAVPELRQSPAVVAMTRRRVETAIALSRLALRSGNLGEVIPRLWAVAADEPLHEGMQAALARSLAANGERVAALEVVSVVRDRLAEELGIEPGTELINLDGAIRYGVEGP